MSLLPLVRGSNKAFLTAENARRSAENAQRCQKTKLVISINALVDAEINMN